MAGFLDANPIKSLRSRLSELGNYGMRYNDLLIKNSQAIGFIEGQMGGTGSGMENDLMRATLALSDTTSSLKTKSIEYANVPTLAYTHLQQAQLTTIGKRFTMWNADIAIDIDNLNNVITQLPFRGIKGTVGTEDTVLKLFNGDHSKCNLLNKKLGNKYGFTDEQLLIICGQTYSRKYDVMVFQLMSIF
jgi:adenylosuccinate lyase